MVIQLPFFVMKTSGENVPVESRLWVMLRETSQNIFPAFDSCSSFYKGGFWLKKNSLICLSC